MKEVALPWPLQEALSSVMRQCLRTSATGLERDGPYRKWGKSGDVLNVRCSSTAILKKSGSGICASPHAAWQILVFEGGSRSERPSAQRRKSVRGQSSSLAIDPALWDGKERELVQRRCAIRASSKLSIGPGGVMEIEDVRADLCVMCLN